MPARVESIRPPCYMASPKSEKEHAHYLTKDWKERRLRIAIRDAYRCRDCTRVAYGRAGHCDHIVPLEDGGTDADDNLAWRCDRCHGRKTRGEQLRKRGR